MDPRKCSPRTGKSKSREDLAPRGGSVKVVQVRKAKALKGNRSRSFQLLTPDTVGTENMLITFVEVLPKGITPLHEHPHVESMYFILEGRGEVISGRQKKIVVAGAGGHFPSGGRHREPEGGRTKLPYLSCHVPPYDIERLYKQWEGKLLVLGGEGRARGDAPRRGGGDTRGARQRR